MSDNTLLSLNSSNMLWLKKKYNYVDDFMVTAERDKGNFINCGKKIT